MKQRVTKFKMAALLLAALVFMTGCSLIDTNIGDFQADNSDVTSGAEFRSIVMAERIGAGNQPVDVTYQFDSSQRYIYVVLEADYIQAGTTMFARWYFEGQPFEDSTQLTADRDYRATYVEFHLENLTGRMQDGDYSVEIFVNGNSVVEEEFEVR
jgi:hypothetical protein